jgi:hypothetical protein
MIIEATWAFGTIVGSGFDILVFLTGVSGASHFLSWPRIELIETAGGAAMAAEA